jgi:hypothetical protein
MDSCQKTNSHLFTSPQTTFSTPTKSTSRVQKPIQIFIVQRPEQLVAQVCPTAPKQPLKVLKSCVEIKPVRACIWKVKVRRCHGCRWHTMRLRLLGRSVRPLTTSRMLTWRGCSGDRVEQIRHGGCRSLLEAGIDRRCVVESLPVRRR